jgi:anti-anti-sigma regulatory factor
MVPLPHFEQLRVTNAGDVLVLTFREAVHEGDDHALAAAREELAIMASARPGANIVCDIANSESLSSPVLQLLIGLHRRLLKSGGTLRLRGLPTDFDDLWPGTGP